MATFSLTSFAAVVTGMIVEVDHAMREALEEAGTIVQEEAQRVIGTYDYNWTPLSPYTLARKSADTPLLETGEMRESIQHEVNGNIIPGLRVYIGSDNMKAVWHEFGTSRIPARPFLRGALDHTIRDIVHRTGRRVHTRMHLRY